MRAGSGGVQRRTLVHVRLSTGGWLAGWFAARAHERFDAEVSELEPLTTDDLVLRLPGQSTGRKMKLAGTSSR